jgi:hypothetical protein
MIAAAIVACELAFWLLLLGGLATRYGLGRARLGAILLLGVPAVDVVLCAVTAIDLAGGARADWTHGLAAAYLGFSAAFGPLFIRGADRRFARRFGDVPREAPRRTAFEDRIATEWRLWLRCVTACLLASAVLGVLMLLADDAQRTRALWADGGWFTQLAAVCFAWLLLGPGWTPGSRRITRSQGHRSR